MNEGIGWSFVICLVGTFLGGMWAGYKLLVYKERHSRFPIIHLNGGYADIIGSVGVLVLLVGIVMLAVVINYPQPW